MTAKKLPNKTADQARLVEKLESWSDAHSTSLILAKYVTNGSGDKTKAIRSCAHQPYRPALGADLRAILDLLNVDVNKTDFFAYFQTSMES